MLKRGQSEVGFGTILLIVLGIVGLILVGLFLYKTYKNVNEVVALTPELLATAAELCKQEVKLAPQLYCNDFKEIKTGAITQYLNCKYIAETTIGANPNQIKESWELASEPPSCSASAEESKCRLLAQSKSDAEFKKIRINNNCYNKADCTKTTCA